MGKHLISRSLTKPWERTPGRLVYIELEADGSGSRKEGYSESLFAKQAAFPSRAEKLWSDLFETPLGNWKARWNRAGGGGDDIPPLDDRTAEAMYIGMLSTIERVAAFFPDTADISMAEIWSLAEMSEEAARKLVSDRGAVFRQGWSLAVYFQSGTPFFFPDAGFFACPVTDVECVTQNGFIFCMPLTPESLIVLSPPGLDLSSVIGPQVTAWSLQNYSVGARSTKVVVPPAFWDAPEAQLVANVAAAQRQSRELLADVERLRSSSLAVHKAIGLPPPRKTLSGRYVRDV